MDHTISGRGDRPLEVFVDVLNQAFGVGVTLVSGEEQQTGDGAQHPTVAFVVLNTAHGERVFGAGLHECRITAGLAAVVSALNRSVRLAGVEL